MSKYDHFFETEYDKLPPEAKGRLSLRTAVNVVMDPIRWKPIKLAGSFNIPLISKPDWRKAVEATVKKLQMQNALNSFLEQINSNQLRGEDE